MSSSPAIDDVSAVVVHHNSPDTLGHTLRALAAAGLPRSRVLVVDNSPDPSLTAAVEADGYEVLRVENRGYAGAVNDGIRELEASGSLRRFLLVSTHESMPEPDAVGELRGALVGDPSIAVAGPTLLNADRDGETWSHGGRLTPRLKLPRHIDEAEAAGATPVIDREWLDGAFTLYRTSDLQEFGLSELYFLYFEETDLHTRLTRSGRRVVWVPAARASQRSSGIPPRLLGRNLFLFHRRLFSPTRGRIAVLFESGRSVARKVLTRRGGSGDWFEILRGWREGEQIARSTETAAETEAR